MENSRGGEEYLEEVPALLVIVLGLSIFILSIAQAHVAYAVQAGNVRNQELSWQFTNAIAAYEELTWDDKNGVFDSVKVCTLPDSTLLREFDPDVLGFEYRISIMDVSGYPLEHRYSYQVGSGQVPVSGDVFTTVRPAVIRHSGGEYHAAHLVVSIWK